MRRRFKQYGLIVLALALCLAAGALLARIVGSLPLFSGTPLQDQRLELIEPHGAVARLENGLKLPPGATLRIHDPSLPPKHQRLVLRLEKTAPVPAEIGVVTQDVVISSPLDDEMLPGKPFEVDIVPQGDEAVFHHDGNDYLRARRADIEARSFFVYARWAPLLVHELRLENTLTGRTALHVSFPDRTRKKILRWLGGVVFIVLLFLIELAVARATHVSPRSLALSWTLTTFPPLGLAAAAVDTPFAPHVAWPALWLWLFLRARFWVLRSRLPFTGTHRLSSAFIALAGLGALTFTFVTSAPAVVVAAWALAAAVIVTMRLDLEVTWRRAVGTLGPFLAVFLPIVLTARLGDPFRWFLPLGVLAMTIPVSHHRKSLRAYGALMLILVVASLALAEWTLGQTELRRHLQPHRIGDDYQTDKLLYWVPKNLFGYADSFPYKHTKDVRAVRFRGHEDAPLEKAPGRLRIMTLGGSNVWGDGQPSNDTAFSGLLETNLREAGHDVEVLNAGVRGFNSFQVMVLYTEYAARYRPDLVVIYMGFNDHTNPRGLFTVRQLWESARSESWVRRMQRGLSHSLLYNGYSRLIVAGRQRLAMQLGRDFLRGTNPLSDIRANLRDVIDLTRNQGGKVLLASEFHGQNWTDHNNDRRQLDIRRVLRELAEAEGFPYLDAWSYFAAKPQPLDYVWPHDPVHFNDAGHADMARLLQRALIENDLL
ncbi:MAG: SGNH/GDSL hydrolase family protein [Candidatus Lernaella stagnicola]|nr:SGNH/GDSL hydrolase family protein [Candidatus Lernaella stagnicola]